MQGVLSPSAKTTLDRAAILANERKTRVGTLHILAAALEGPSDLARRLKIKGLRAQDLRAASKTHQESEVVFERVNARAHKLAEMTHASELLCTHLLAAALTESKTSLAAWVVTLGVDPVQLAEELVRECTGPAMVRATPVLQVAVRTATGGTSLARSSAISQPSSRNTTVTPVITTQTVSSVASRVKLSPMDARRVAPTRTLVAAANANAIPVEAPRSQTPPRVTRVSRERIHAEAALDTKRTPVLASLVVVPGNVGEMPFLGRSSELERMRDALGRREGRGTLLVGVAGVGRTALVHAFAAEATVPVVLLRHVEMAARMRGPEAEVARGICAEIRKSGAVVALDPLAPWLLGREIPDEVQFELRSILASGTVPWIAIATPDEARRLSEIEPWIDRASVRIDLEELPAPVVREVVCSRAQRLAQHHKVDVTPEVSLRTVELTDRFLGGRAQPDRALGILDLAFARARRLGAKSLDASVVASVVAETGGFSPARVAATDQERLLALEDHLAARVVGHQTALSRAAHVLRRNAVGFRGQRPIGTFLLLGPTGVGKTETAKAIAEAMFPGASAMTRFDMAEYAESHTVARLVGAPPGYVGYGDGGQLTEAVRRKPYQLILLDEIEKAHRDVLESLLGMLDEARMTDGRGRTVDFRNTVIVMTSNLGAELYRERSTVRSIGFGANSQKSFEDVNTAVLTTARSSLPPELWNRIDEPLVFGPLSRPEMSEVARRMLRASLARLEEDQGITTSTDDTLVELLLDQGGYDVSLGARPMRRSIARMVEAPIAETVLRGELRRGDHAQITAQEGLVRIIKRPVQAVRLQ
jgi:ATP-dependent Clp protease ATP-binding subunit ClpC